MRSRKIKPRFFVIVSLMTALFFFGGVKVVQMRIDQEAKQLARVRLEQQALVDAVNELEAEIEYVQSDEYIKDAARDDLGMIMPGEIRYMSDGN